MCCSKADVYISVDKPLSRDLPDVFQDKKRCAWSYTNRQAHHKNKYSKSAILGLPKGDISSHHGALQGNASLSLQTDESAAQSKENQLFMDEGNEDLDSNGCVIDREHLSTDGRMLPANSTLKGGDFFESEDLRLHRLDL